VSQDLFVAHARAAAEVAADPGLPASVDEAATRLGAVLRQGGSILCAGNGGSASTADHLAAELVGRFRTERPPWRAWSLTGGSAVASALANDFGYGEAIARQIRAVAQRGDAIVLFTTSGRSPNLLEAASTARHVGCDVIACTGRDPGPLGPMSDLVVNVPIDESVHVQELHTVVVHALVDLLEHSLCADGPRP
jgi:D-sedoheptulose 7-phosphate isomerase